MAIICRACAASARQQVNITAEMRVPGEFQDPLILKFAIPVRCWRKLRGPNPPVSIYSKARVHSNACDGCTALCHDDLAG